MPIAEERNGSYHCSHVKPETCSRAYSGDPFCRMVLDARCLPRRILWPSLRHCKKYVDANLTCDLVSHEPAMSSMRTALVTHISGERIAKGVVLRGDGGYVLAVLPASRHIHLEQLEMDSASR
jgi:hypothetical protein